MADIFPMRFSIDSTMEYATDAFSTDLPGSAVTRAASTSDRVTLRTGLKDGSNISKFVTQMLNAVVDEYEVTITPTGVTERLRGRDLGALLMDRTYKTLYRRSPVVVTQEQVPPPDGTPVVPVKVGRFNASGIAGDAVASVGMNLSWGCPDYQLLTDFNANGRIIDILRQLIQPWNLVALFKVDIYISGTTVVVASRQYPISRIDFTSTLAASKRSQIIIRKRPTLPYGLVTLRGQKVPRSDVDPNGTPVATNKFFNVTYESLDPNGSPTARQAYDVTYRMPDNVLIFERKTSYAPNEFGSEIMVSRETTNNIWTSVQYDAQGRPLTPALEQSSVTTVERVEPSDESQTLRVWERSTTTYAYDANNFIAATTTIKEALDLDTETLINSEMVLKDIIPTAPLLNDTVTTVYKWEQDANGTFTWIFQRRDVAPTGGHKPGGPGRGQPTTITIPNPTQPGSNQGGQQQIVLAQQFSSNGLDFSYSNENLTMGELQFIMSQFAAAENVWEYEVEFAGVAQPWLQRGTTIQFTQVLLEDGVTALPIPPLLITEVRSKYDESRSAASAVYQCRAFGYSAS